MAVCSRDHDGENLVLSDRRDASERRIAGAGLRRGVFSDSGRFLVAPHTLDPQRKADLSLRIIDATGGSVRAYPGQWAVPVPGDRALVANEADHQPATLSLLDLASGAPLWTRSFPQVFRDGDWTWKPGNQPPPGLRLGPDGHTFALRSGHTWNWIDLETGGPRVHLEHSAPPLLLRDGRRATVRGDDLWVWDAAVELPELDGNDRMLSPRADHALAIRDPGALPTDRASRRPRLGPTHAGGLPRTRGLRTGLRHVGPRRPRPRALGQRHLAQPRPNRTPTPRRPLPVDTGGWSALDRGPQARPLARRARGRRQGLRSHGADRRDHGLDRPGRGAPHRVRAR
jgi:hypothetical protein